MIAVSLLLSVLFALMKHSKVKSPEKLKSVEPGIVIYWFADCEKETA